MSPRTPLSTRRSWLYGGVAAVAAAAGMGGAWWRHRLAPGGKSDRLDESFWALQFERLDGFSRQHAATGWQVVGLAIDQPSSVRKFLDRTPVGYLIGLAGLQGTELVRSLGNTAGGLPFTLVLDAKEAVRGRKMGQIHASDLEAWRHAVEHG